MNKVFLYGTLKNKNYSAMYFLPGQNPLAGLECHDATIDGELFLFPRTHIPAVKIGCTGQVVKGEVYEVDDALLAMLDKIEGHPDLYLRTEIQTIEGETVFVYTFQSADQTGIRIESGDYQFVQLDNVIDERPIRGIALTRTDDPEGVTIYSYEDDVAYRIKFAKE